MRDSEEYKLAELVVHLQDALDMANKVLKENGKLGVLPDRSISFRAAQKFHKRVRAILKYYK